MEISKTTHYPMKSGRRAMVWESEFMDKQTQTVMVEDDATKYEVTVWWDVPHAPNTPPIVLVEDNNYDEVTNAHYVEYECPPIADLFTMNASDHSVIDEMVLEAVFALATFDYQKLSAA